MLYKSPCRRHRCHYVSFASEEVEVRKEKEKRRPEKTPTLSIWRTGNPVWNRRRRTTERIWSRKKTLSKNLITYWNYLPKLTYLLEETIRKTTWKKQNKRNPKVKTTLSWNLKLEIEASWKTKTKKQTKSTVYLELSMSCKNKTKSVSCSKNKKEKRSKKKKGKKYEVQLTLENYKRKV